MTDHIQNDAMAHIINEWRKRAEAEAMRVLQWQAQAARLEQTVADLTALVEDLRIAIKETE